MFVEYGSLYECPKCDREFDTEVGLKIHMTKMHPPNWFQKLFKKIFK